MRERDTDRRKYSETDTGRDREMGQQQQQEGPVAMEEDVKMETTAEDSRHLQHGFSPDYLTLSYGKLCVFLAPPSLLPFLLPSLPCVFFFPSSPISFVIPLFFFSKQASKQGGKNQRDCKRGNCVHKFGSVLSLKKGVARGVVFFIVFFFPRCFCGCCEFDLSSKWSFLLSKVEREWR